MRLPTMSYSDGIGKTVQTAFGGYNHTRQAKDGELFDMMNLTGDYTGLLATRRQRRLAQAIGEPGGIGSLNGLYWVSGDGFFYKGERKGTVTKGEKIFAGMGSRVIIFPDKAVYDTEADTFESLEASYTSSAGGTTFANGTLYGEAAEANTITVAAEDFKAIFKAGDAVTISGCTKHPENNKTPIIREISEDGHSLHFYEFVFTLDGTEEQPANYTEPGAITLARTVPDMDWICVNENRLWGCKGDEIYASKLGDPTNFNVFDGLASDSWSVPSGSAGSFTGCIGYLGYPCFFKEDRIFKVYGSKPSNYELMGSATMGVKEGCGRSLAIANEVLFYVARNGPTAYSGGIPSFIGDVFGLEDWSDAVAGSDGLKYYVSMADAAGARHLFCYDSRKGLWMREDETNAMGFAMEEGLHLLTASGDIWRLDGGGEGQEEGTVSWYAEFADFTEGSPDAKGYSKIQIRMEMEAGAMAEVKIQYDSSGIWESAGKAETQRKRTFLLPVIPRRADHYRIRLEGEGGCTVFSLARSYYSGSDHRTIR